MKKLALFLTFIMMCSAVLPLLSSCQNKGNDATADKPLSPPSLNIDPALEKDFNVQAKGEDIVIVGVKDYKIKELVIPEGVTVIGDRAFTGCDYLEKITIADSVKVIKEQAFRYCDRLQTVKFGENSQLTTIEEYAFDKIEHFFVPKNVSSISPNAFNHQSLVSIEVDQDNETFRSIEGSLYSKDGKTLYLYANGIKNTHVSIPDGVTTIGKGAFIGDEVLTYIHLPNSLMHIEQWAFSNCENLKGQYDNGAKYIGNEQNPRLALISYDPSSSAAKEYVIGADTQVIAVDAFAKYRGTSVISVVHNHPHFKAIDNVLYTKDGTELVYYSRKTNTHFTIPDGVTTIRDYAFYDTPHLQSLTMANSVTHIGEFGLSSYSLENIKVSNSLTYIGDHCFEVAQAQTIRLPDTLQYIGDYAFSGCAITGIQIPDSVTYVGDYAFMYAEKLQNVTFSSSCSTITEGMFFACRGLGEIVIPSNIRLIEGGAFSHCENLKKITLKEGVSWIDHGAFSFCTHLESIHLPATISYIGKKAFEYCVALKNIAVSANNAYYSSREGHLYSKDKTVLLYFAPGNDATEFSVPKTVTAIGTYAFMGNTKLSSITLPEKLKHIDDYAFYQCTHLQSINFPDSLETVGDYAFDGCTKLEDIILGNQLTTIGQCAFRECTSVKQVTFGENVTTIGNYAFSSCKGLTSIDLGGKISEIGQGAFSSCSNLKEVTFGNNVKTIGAYAFSGCAISKLTLPQSVTKIGDFAFQRCPFYSVAIPENVSYVNGSAFLGCPLYDVYLVETNPYFKIIDGDLYSSDGKTFLWYTPGHTKESFTLPDSVTTISTGAFYMNPLKTIVIPDGVTTIEDRAFYYCDHLESMIIPDSVTYLGVSAFANCSALKSAVIGNGVTRLSYSVFSGCTSLTDVVIGEGVTDIESSAFYGCTSLRKVVMGRNVRHVQMGAFMLCEYIDSVYYRGTAEEWANILFEFYSNESERIKRASLRYYYSETQPSEEGKYWHYDENNEIVIW